MKAELGGSFLDRLTQELRDAWGMKVNGSFTADAGIVFNAGVFAAPHEEADYQEGVYSFYYCELPPEVLPCSRRLIGRFSTTVYFNTMEILCAVDTVFPNLHWETLLQSVRGGQWFARVLRFDMITLEFAQMMGNSIRVKRAIFACSRGSLTLLSIRRSTCWSATCVQTLLRCSANGSRRDK